MSFIRFTPINYVLEEQTECLPEEVDTSLCPSDHEVYEIPAKPEDEFSWIVDKETVNPMGAQVEQLRVGLLNCGMLVPGAEDIGTILEAEGQYFIVANIPADTVDCTYNFVIYNINNPVDCSQFAGMTLDEVIATGVTLNEVLHCTLNDFLP